MPWMSRDDKLDFITSDDDDKKKKGGKTMEKEFLTKEEAVKINKALEEKLVKSFTKEISEGNKAAEETIAKRFERLEEREEVLDKRIGIILEEIKNLKSGSSYLTPAQQEKRIENLKRMNSLKKENEEIDSEGFALAELDRKISS